MVLWRGKDNRTKGYHLKAVNFVKSGCIVLAVGGLQQSEIKTKMSNFFKTTDERHF